MDAPQPNGEQHNNLSADLTKDADHKACVSARPQAHEGFGETQSDAHQTCLQTLKSLIKQQADRLRELESELAQAKKQVALSARSQAEFMDTMSHELRTPLNGILGMTQLIMDMSLSGEARDHLKIIDESGQHLASIIDQILDYAHLTRGKVTLTNSTFELENALNEVINPHIKTIYDNDLELILDYDLKHGSAVIADQKRVQQIVAIVLGNAVKFTTKGHISVNVTTKHAEKPTENPVPMAALEIRIEDTGVGIDPDDHELIFMPFRQADGSMKRKHGGIGLGLSLCAALVALMQGEITLDSNKGKGATFTVTIPVQVVPSQKHAFPPFSPATLGIICNLTAQTRAIAHMVYGWNLHPLVWHPEENASPGAAPPQAAAWIVEYEPGMVSLMKSIRTIRRGPDSPRPVIIALIRPGLKLSLNERALFEVVLEKPLRRKNLYEALSFGFNASAGMDQPSNEFRTSGVPSSYLLLIEPNRINQRVLLRILENLAIKVDVISELNQIGDSWAESHYDAILVNPTSDTSEEMAKLRDFAWSVQKDGGPRLVALLPKEGPLTPERLKAAGISRHLTMPVNLDALRAAIG